MIKKILLASAILASTVGVAAANPAPYLGASVGINVNTSTKSAGGTAGVYRGIPVKLFAGYGGEISQGFYLAGELTGALGTGEITNKNNMRTTYGFGISVIPGMMLTDHTLAFARAGFVRTRFSNVNTMKTGGQVGLGLQSALTQNIDLRGEYDYTAYGSLAGISSPRTDEFSLGLVYKFD